MLGSRVRGDEPGRETSTGASVVPCSHTSKAYSDMPFGFILMAEILLCSTFSCVLTVYFCEALGQGREGIGSCPK